MALDSQDYAQALTSAELAIDENGCRSLDDVDVHVEGIAEMYGDEIAEVSKAYIIELLACR